MDSSEVGKSSLGYGSGSQGDNRHIKVLIA
jgi:hypothetical protein